MINITVAERTKYENTARALEEMRKSFLSTSTITASEGRELVAVGIVVARVLKNAGRRKTETCPRCFTENAVVRTGEERKEASVRRQLGKLIAEQAKLLAEIGDVEAEAKE